MHYLLKSLSVYVFTASIILSHTFLSFCDATKDQKILQEFIQLYEHAPTIKQKKFFLNLLKDHSSKNAALVIPIFISALKNEAHQPGGYEIEEIAKTALSRLPPPLVKIPLQSLFEDERPDKRSLAYEMAYCFLDKKYKNESELHETQYWIDKLCEGLGDEGFIEESSIRTQVISHLQDLSNDFDFFKKLENLASHKDQKFRHGALMAMVSLLWLIPDDLKLDELDALKDEKKNDIQNVKNFILPIFRGEDNDKKIEILKAITETTYAFPGAKPVLHQLLKNPNPAVRLEALRALAASSFSSFPWEEILKGQDPDLKKEALKILISYDLGNPSKTPKDYFLNYYAFSKKIVFLLIKLLLNKDEAKPQILLALKTLKSIGAWATEAVPAVLLVLDQGDTELKQEALDTLRWIGSGVQNWAHWTVPYLKNFNLRDTVKSIIRTLRTPDQLLLVNKLKEQTDLETYLHLAKILAEEANSKEWNAETLTYCNALAEPLVTLSETQTPENSPFSRLKRDTLEELRNGVSRTQDGIVFILNHSNHRDLKIWAMQELARADSLSIKILHALHKMLQSDDLKIQYMALSLFERTWTVSHALKPELKLVFKTIGTLAHSENESVSRRAITVLLRQGEVESLSLLQTHKTSLAKALLDLRPETQPPPPTLKWITEQIIQSPTSPLKLELHFFFALSWLNLNSKNEIQNLDFSTALIAGEILIQALSQPDLEIKKLEKIAYQALETLGWNSVPLFLKTAQQIPNAQFSSELLDQLASSFNPQDLKSDSPILSELISAFKNDSDEKTLPRDLAQIYFLFYLGENSIPPLLKLLEEPETLTSIATKYRALSLIRDLGEKAKKALPALQKLSHNPPPGLNSSDFDHIIKKISEMVSKN